MTRGRALLIVNPSSGRELAAESADRIEASLRRRYDDVEVVTTAGDGDAERAAATAAGAGRGTVFVAGGDGTVNEAVNGVASAGALSDVRFGIIPLGTGNDFAAGLDIPVDVGGALHVLAQECELRVDLGSVNGRLFINTSGGGYIAEVSVAVTPHLKTIAGRLAYLIGGAQALLEYEPVSATITAEPGGLRLGLKLYAFAVCNSRLIGGGRLIAPSAIIDDGLLDVCLIEGMSTVEFLNLARKVAAGDHVDEPRVRYFQASSLVIELEPEAWINTDGEVLSARRCEYTVRPGAATFLVGDAPFSTARCSAALQGYREGSPPGSNV